MSILSIFNAKSDEEALNQLLEAGKQKLIEAGKEIVQALGNEIDGLEVQVTIKVSRKSV